MFQVCMYMLCAVPIDSSWQTWYVQKWKSMYMFETCTYNFANLNVCTPSANWGQIIGYYWFYPYCWQLLAIIAIIGHYWAIIIIIILAIIFLQNVFILLAIIATSSNINYCNYCDTIIPIIVSARNYLHYC